MPIALVDVNTIVTDDYFNTFLGGYARTRLGLTDDQQSTYAARQYGLNRVLEALRRRVPPIHYHDLVSPEELRDATCYAAAEHLYQLAITSPNDVHDTQRQIWAEKFDHEMNGLMLTLRDGIQVPAESIHVGRR
jgi:hypothetical protein